MKHRVVEWRWEDPDAQDVFAELVGFPDRERTLHEIDRIEEVARLRPGQRVLDAGCGMGRHSIELTRRGYDVVGIDVAERYLDVARADAASQAMRVDFRLQRLADLPERESFDFALAFNHTLGFMTDDELSHHLRVLHDALKPEGLLLLVLAGPRLVESQRDEVPSRSWTTRSGKYVLVEKQLSGGFRLERTILIDPAGEEVVEYRERQRAFSLSEVIGLLAAAGFRDIQCFKDLDRNPATTEEFGGFLCVRNL